MSDSFSDGKTTKDLLRRVEEERAEESSADARSDDEKRHEGTSSPTPEAPGQPKKVRSFTSYMSNVKQRQVELAELKRRDEERRNMEEEGRLQKQKEEEAEALRIKEAEEQDFLKRQELERQKLADEQRNDEELLRMKQEGESKKIDEEELEKVRAEKEQLEKGRPENEKSETPLISEDEKPTPSDDPITTDHSTSALDQRSQNVDEIMRDASVTNTEDSKPELQEEASASPIPPNSTRRPSALSSELSQLPSDDEKYSDVLETIREDDKQDFTPENTPHKRSDSIAPEEDSDADTVFGSPPKKRGRLIRKSDLDSSSRPVKKVDFDDSDHDDGLPQKKKKKKSYGALQNSSRSVSPNRTHSKRPKGGRDPSGRRMLQRVCEKGLLDQARILIEDGADVDDKDNAGNTALHEAALLGFTDIVELLLQNGATVDIQNDVEDLDTPLIDAAANGHVETVKVLLRYGADPRIENARGQNALDSLEEGGNDTESLKQLLREATTKLVKEKKSHESGHTSDVDERSRSGSRPRVSSDRRVISARSDMLFMDFTSRHGLEAVYKKASDGDMEFVGHYLQNVNKPDAEALALAAKFGHTDVANLFLAFGAKVDLPNENGQTALMRTVGRGHLDTVKLLLDAGADVTKRSKDGKNALDYARGSLIVNEEEIEMLQSHIDGRPVKAPSNPSQAEESHEPKKTSQKKRKLSTKDDSLEQSPEAKPKKKKVTLVEAEIKPTEKSRVMERKSSSSGSISGPSTSKSEVKRVVSGSRIEPKPVVREPELPAPPPPETEEEKQARIVREKEEQRARELYAAEEEAKKKARAQSYLIKVKTEEKKKEEEMRKLLELEEERKRKEAEALKAKLREQEKLEEEKMKTEEVERRQKIRESYPTGLRTASFEREARSREEAVHYLPIYRASIDGIQYVIDLQVILTIGLEDFTSRYKDELYTDAKVPTTEEKSQMFRFMFPVLAKTNVKSVSKRLENYSEELAKFHRLKLTWVKFDTAMDIVKRDFSDLHTLFTSRTMDINLSAVGNAGRQEFIKPAGFGSHHTQRSVSGNVALVEMKNKLPLSLRVRTAVVKSLARNKKMW